MAAQKKPTNLSLSAVLLDECPSSNDLEQAA